MRIPREVVEALRTTQAQLDRVRPRHVAALLEAARDIQRALERRLRQIGGPSYTAVEVATVLSQVRAVIEVLGAEYGVRVGDELERVGRLAAKVGRDGLVSQLAAWGPRYEGAVRRIVDVTTAADVLDPGLLEYYRTSRERYGMDAIGKMRGVLSRSALGGKTVSQTWQEMSEAVEIQEWKAERIVRTEQSFAKHRRQKLDLEETYGEEADEIWKKQLVATLDTRTGEDSIFVNGQVRGLDEEFEDNQGRRYQHPPNRPNDREVVVFLMPEDEAQGGASDA